MTREVLTEFGVTVASPAEARMAEEIARLRQWGADETFDQTEGAHPAWWRGYEHGCAVMMQHVTKVLDGQPITGVANEPWESLRRRLAAHVTAAKALRDAVPVLHSAHMAGIPCATIDLAAASVAIQQLNKAAP